MKTIAAAIVVASGVFCLCTGSILKWLAFTGDLPKPVQTVLATGTTLLWIGGIISVIGLVGWFKASTVRDPKDG